MQFAVPAPSRPTSPTDRLAELRERRAFLWDVAPSLEMGAVESEIRRVESALPDAYADRRRLGVSATLPFEGGHLLWYGSTDPSCVCARDDVVSESNPDAPLVPHRVGCRRPADGHVYVEIDGDQDPVGLTHETPPPDSAIERSPVYSIDDGLRRIRRLAKVRPNRPRIQFSHGYTHETRRLETTSWDRLETTFVEWFNAEPVVGAAVADLAEAA